MSCTLYVANLHPEVTESLLWGKFGSVSQVYSIHLQRDKVSGVSLEYAYVNYRQRSEAERAFKLLNLDLLLGEPMYVMWSPDDSHLRATNVGNIFIGNLEESIDTLALYNTFATFGNILRCKVVPGVDGSGGRGFVHYERVEAAEAAIKRLNGMLFNDQKVFITHFRSFKERKGVSAVPAIPAAAIPPAAPAAAIPPAVRAANLAAPTPALRVVRGAAPAAAKKTLPPLVPAAVLAAAKPIQCVGSAAVQAAAAKTVPHVDPAATLGAVRVVRGAAPASPRKRAPPLVPCQWPLVV